MHVLHLLFLSTFFYIILRKGTVNWNFRVYGYVKLYPQFDIKLDREEIYW